MKRICLSSLLLLIIMFSTGCEQPSQSPAVGAYQLYRLDSAGIKLVAENIDLESEKTEQMIEEMIGKLVEKPESDDMQELLPEDIQIVAATIKDQDLVLDFSENYHGLDNVREVLGRAGLVKSLVQIPGVNTVAITVGEEELIDASGTAIGKMIAERFLDSRGESINPYQYSVVTLYFPNESGEQVAKEMRDIYYSSNNSLEKVVVEEVLKGPDNTKLQSVVNEATNVLSVTTQDGLCSINFNAAFNQKQAEKNITPEAAIYALVNSLCDSTGVNQVQIQIEGDSSVLYLDTVDISKPLQRNDTIIYNIDSKMETEIETKIETETETPTEIKKPSVGADHIAPNSQ